MRCLMAAVLAAGLLGLSPVPAHARGDEQDGFDRAILDFTEAIRLDPRLAAAYHNRGNAWHAKADYDKAIADYTEAIRLDPMEYRPLACRARVWSTCPDPRYRDGDRAIESATRACELTRWKDAFALGSLAAAYAESGDFHAAVHWQTEAVELYQDETDRKAAREHLALYEQRMPYRETPGVD